MIVNLGLLKMIKHQNQQAKPQSAKGECPAQYNNWKVIAKSGSATMILAFGLSKVNASALRSKLDSFINNKHKAIEGAGKTSIKFIIIH